MNTEDKYNIYYPQIKLIYLIKLVVINDNCIQQIYNILYIYKLIICK